MTGKTKRNSAAHFDLVVIGGGVNGCGIARDAAGRGLSVLLCEQGDLAQATSSASTKLFHGGLRYLEYFEFRLVREALKERETLLRAMPHISWPLRFVLPYDPALRFPADASGLGRVLRYAAPFLRGRRPAWMIRAGLFAYDHLGGRCILPGTKTLRLADHPAGKPLQPRFARAFEYSDCWVEDSRLVVLNARDAAAHGARILTRTRCDSAARSGAGWRVDLTDLETGTTQSVTAAGIVNAGGPWVEDILKTRLGQQAAHGVRLVRGSHIVTRRLFDHGQPYFFQLPDGRIIFAIPYETDFTLIGTTDQDHRAAPGAATCTEEERDYLLAAANRFFTRALTPADVVWSFSGVRPLYDDNASSATAATRDYVLTLQDENGAAPLLSVFGGKITTYRRLAEQALARLERHFPQMSGPWTAGAPLPGGDFPVDGAPALMARLRAVFPFLTEAWAARLVRAYGRDAYAVLGQATCPADLGEDFGATLHAAEVLWLIRNEWVKSADDILWRRSKLGLRLDTAAAARLEAFISETRGAPVQPAER
ncbi:MAG: glycerol-3-phosphate dehydrogenase [Pseudomonadota bacterium]|nr:glycerol-3-phosphate dehydrogenase [Pseudomonadota bacterium]